MSDPTTAAGRALLDAIATVRGFPKGRSTAESIRAIEVEAAAMATTRDRGMILTLRDWLGWALSDPREERPHGLRRALAVIASTAAYADTETWLDQSIAGPGAREAADLLETAWGVIANAGGGDWTRESEMWQQAATQWRDRYFAALRAAPQAQQAPSIDAERLFAAIPEDWTPFWTETGNEDARDGMREVAFDRYAFAEAIAARLGAEGTSDAAGHDGGAKR